MQSKFIKSELDFPGREKFNQVCANSFRKVLNGTDTPMAGVLSMQNQNTHARARSHKHRVFQPRKKSDQIRWRTDKHIKARIVSVFLLFFCLVVFGD